ncbi:hypothetical protein K0M31_003590 [Melipona bicolor]|uniref:Uncharacterized protein n=1 Tax=Melipona bicolor TaxID=60889 RepID=A0AA40FZX3_9HYME|nr:hypothetical protein K0M31_003590 [Melipona bicolor]
MTTKSYNVIHTSGTFNFDGCVSRGHKSGTQKSNGRASRFISVINSWDPTRSDTGSLTIRKVTSVVNQNMPETSLALMRILGDPLEVEATGPEKANTAERRSR